MVSTTDPAQVLRTACNALLNGNLSSTKEVVRKGYPFSGQPALPRRYSELQKLRIFVRDGFIDRYTGTHLVFVGILRLFSFLMPEEFPYHPNGKLDRCHLAYWQLMPTLDHIVPLTRGGRDHPENWITTSMVSNGAKANWTLEELGWTILPSGNLTEWDGLMATFIALVDSEATLSQEKYLKSYYRIAKTVLAEHHSH